MLSLYRSHLHNAVKLKALLDKIASHYAQKPSRVVFEVDGIRFNASQAADVAFDADAGSDNIEFRRPPNAAAAAKASFRIQDLDFSAKTAGEDGNDITIEYVTGGTAGSEEVTVLGTAISVEIEPGETTAQQIKDAIEAELAADALVDVVLVGDGSEPQAAQAVTALVGGAEQSDVEKYDLADIRLIKRLRTKKWLIAIKSGANPA